MWPGSGESGPGGRRAFHSHSCARLCSLESGRPGASPCRRSRERTAPWPCSTRSCSCASSSPRSEARAEPESRREASTKKSRAEEPASEKKAERFQRPPFPRLVSFPHGAGRDSERVLSHQPQGHKWITLGIHDQRAQLCPVPAGAPRRAPPVCSTWRRLSSGELQAASGRSRDPAASSDKTGHARAQGDLHGRSRV